jgi:peptidoglycan/LPS O-acetylase OafA/YrhL
MIEGKDKQRIGVLDSFRGLAALAVMYYHYTYWFRIRHSHTFSDYLDFPYGTYCVSFFFIISGFVIFMTVNRCNDSVEFLYRRFIRIYPAFWICLIITSTFLVFANDKPYQPTLFNFGINATMVPNVFHVKPIDGSYWSLYPELLFYAVIFFVFTLKILDRVYLWGSIWLIGSILNSLFHIPGVNQLFQYAGLFLSGIFIYKMYFGEKTLKQHLSVLVCWAAVLYGYWSAEGSYRSFIPITACYLIFYLFLYHKLNFLDVKPLKFFGRISYPLYLIHQSIGFVILLLLRDQYQVTSYWIISALMLLSIALAYVITFYFEKPLLKLIKENLERFFVKKQTISPTSVVEVRSTKEQIVS